jgi:L-ascorbate metabolism protein UlaG (beta-lactamase superfamily)
MKITWIGHSCFLIEAREARVVTDPFAAEIPYAFPRTSADVVTTSHDHFDHNAVQRVEGVPAVARGPGVQHVAGVEVLGIASSHGVGGGKDRGANTVFAFTLEGIRIAHLGDLGTPLAPAQRSALLDVEVLLLPVGGLYTIDAAAAATLARSLPNVRVVFPMHYRTELVADWPIAPVDEFLRTMDNVRHIGSSSAVLTRATLPEALEVWVLDHA